MYLEHILKVFVQQILFCFFLFTFVCCILSGVFLFDFISLSLILTLGCQDPFFPSCIHVGIREFICSTYMLSLSKEQLNLSLRS